MNQKGAPPLGLIPRWLVDEKRAEEIRMAMERYKVAGMEIPTDWIAELMELELRILQHTSKTLAAESFTPTPTLMQHRVRMFKVAFHQAHQDGVGYDDAVLAGLRAAGVPLGVELPNKDGL